MRDRTTPWLTRLATPVVVGLVASTGLADATLAAPAEGPPWKLAATAEGGEPSDVSLAAENDGWVVGHMPSEGAYVAHWDGTNLTRTDFGGLQTDVSTTQAVDAAASDDVWAVSGRLENEMGNTTDRAYVRSHWDGGKWAHDIADPPADKDDAEVAADVHAFSSNDVWAIGWRTDVTNVFDDTSFVDRYDGTKWTRLELPEKLTSNRVDKVVGIDGNDGDDVWIVAVVQSRGIHRPYALHWDGDGFTMTELPVRWDLKEGWYPRHITVSGQRVWISGSDGRGHHEIAYAYDGQQWSEWTDRPLNHIADMSADPRTGQLVAVGYRGGSLGPGDYATFDGKDWTIHPQAAGVPEGDVFDLSVAQAPKSGRPMAVGRVGQTSFLTSPAE